MSARAFPVASADGDSAAGAGTAVSVTSRAPGPAHPAGQVGADAEHGVRPPGGQPLQGQVDSPGHGSGRRRVVRGDEQRRPPPTAMRPGQGERGRRARAQAVRVHDIGPVAGQQPAQPQHRLPVADPADAGADLHRLERDRREQAPRRRRAEHFDGQSPRRAARGEHRHVTAGPPRRRGDDVGDPGPRPVRRRSRTPDR